MRRIAANIAKLPEPLKRPPCRLSPSILSRIVEGSHLDAVKSVIPDAANRPAGEVLEFVLGALRNCPEKDCSSDSPLIEGT